MSEASYCVNVDSATSAKTERGVCRAHLVFKRVSCRIDGPSVRQDPALN